MSKELAILLGIEAKKYCHGCNDDKGNRIENPETDCTSFPCGNTCWVEFYPDFEKPENFVKLLEMVYKVFDGVLLEKSRTYYSCNLIQGSGIDSSGYGFGNGDNLYLALISALLGLDNRYWSYWLEELKQQAQAVEWVW